MLTQLVVLTLVLQCLGNDNVPNIDPYAVLGVPRTASQSEIRRAYRALALQYHPDKNPTEDTSDIFASINAAYDILGESIASLVESHCFKETLTKEQSMMTLVGQPRATLGFILTGSSNSLTPNLIMTSTLETPSSLVSLVNSGSSVFKETTSGLSTSMLLGVLTVNKP